MTTSVQTSETAHPRVPLTHRRTLFVRALEAYSRRRYGGVLDPGLVALHNRRVLLTLIETETSAARWNRLDHTVKALATMAAAATIGCEWCLDYGYWESHNRGVPAVKLERIARWREAEVYSELERAVIGFAEAMSATPPSVSDRQVDELRQWFDNGQIVELTAMVALENLRSRSNAAMGLTGQGFKDRCEPMGQDRVHER
jgi:AhpD family alkylhydroperoxidase